MYELMKAQAMVDRSLAIHSRDHLDRDCISVDVHQYIALCDFYLEALERREQSKGSAEEVADKVLYLPILRKHPAIGTEERTQVLKDATDIIQAYGERCVNESREGVLEGLGLKITECGEVSDGYHTFRELYEYRRVYNALLFNAWAFLGLYDAHKSKRHSSGEECFGGGWFIVVAQLPQGQISNHYKLEHWDEFQIEERELPATYDGHTPAIALGRLKDRVSLPTESSKEVKG